MPYPFWQLEDQLIPTLTMTLHICKSGFFEEAVKVSQVSSQTAALRPGLGPHPSGDLAASELASRASSSFVSKLRSPLQLTPPSARAHYRKATTTCFPREIKGCARHTGQRHRKDRKSVV